MKKLLLSIAIVGLFTTAAQAQASKQATSQQPAKSNDQRAIEETQKASKQLGLSVEQESKYRGLATTRLNTIVPLRQKAKASTDKVAKDAAHNDIKAARNQFFNDVNAILNAEQQVKWANHKKKMEEKNAGQAD